MPSLVDLDDETGELPLGVPAGAAHGPLDVALATVSRSPDVRFDPQAVAAAALQVSSHVGPPRGAYCVVYRIEDERACVAVLALDHRTDVYHRR